MVIELIGLLGALAFLIGFVEVSLGKWSGQSYRFEILNLFGAILLGYYAYQKHAYMNIVLNIVWGTAALYAVLHVIDRHKIRKRKQKQVRKKSIRT